VVLVAVCLPGVVDGAYGSGTYDTTGVTVALDGCVAVQAEAAKSNSIATVPLSSLNELLSMTCVHR
jgi:hypothetical protein